jgi:ABC-type branched-subunit amino acid transport system ATPase component
MTFFQAENLAINFGGIRAVDNVSFAVDKGEVFTIIGPNGAGKTTIFNLVSRIYQPTAGRLLFEDRDITASPNSASPAPSKTSSCSSMRRCCRTCCWRATFTGKPASSASSCFFPPSAAWKSNTARRSRR